MLKELVVNAAEYETRVALLENSTIAELFIERGDESNIAGSIYKGRIQRVLPGMQAAFVDIGLNQAAFLYVDDILDDAGHDLGKRFEQEMEFDLNNPQSDEPGSDKILLSWKRSYSSSCSIEDLVTEGQEIMVQVAKSPIGTKGPRVTTHISLPGRFMVIMPTVDHIGISKRIENEKERTRLKELLLSIRNDRYGYIFRTAAQGIGESRLAKEVAFLCKTWEDIQKKNRKSSAPSLIYKDLSVILRGVRDLLTDEADKLIIDSRAGYQSVQNFLKKLMPGLNVSVELYDGVEPIFDAYNIEGDIARALKKKVWLKSGGYIIIDQTEALVSIDVNTGRYVGKYNFEETILKTNLEAVKEIAYQIRLRNLGGIIIIDFIDMKKSHNKEKLMARLTEALKKDKSQTNVLPLSELGLVEMTRKRIRKNLARTLCEPCFYCGGDGLILSGKSICHKIYRDLLSESKDMMGNRFTVKVHPEIAQLFHGEEKKLILSLENAINRAIVIYPEPHYHMEEYHIFETLVK
ncbi:MAG: Rne/Rng family ribonuclease [Thermodesulfobacteriota bacterium]|nr:Rne/Rng family ribonuclease [Thermodesulfobacteriota bacterium]